MQFLIALISLVLALFGIDGLGNRTIAIRSIVNGSDVLYSTARINAGFTEFACIRSASGGCHYQLSPPDCAPPQLAANATSGCRPDSVLGFVVAAGGRRNFFALPTHFTLCVAQDIDFSTAHCEMPPVVDGERGQAQLLIPTL